MFGIEIQSAPGGGAGAGTLMAWVNFNGTGTVAIRASGNVSSITDNGTGDYTVNYTTAMPDANYAALVTIGNTGADGFIGYLRTAAAEPTTTSARIGTYFGGSYTDQAYVNFAVIR